MTGPATDTVGDARDPRPERADVSSLLTYPGQAPACVGGFSGTRPPLPLTRRQLQVLRAIALRIERHGYSPSQEEIGADCGTASPSSVCRVLVALAAKGWLRWWPNRARSLELLHRPPPQAFIVVNDPEARLVPMGGADDPA